MEPGTTQTQTQVTTETKLQKTAGLFGSLKEIVTFILFVIIGIGSLAIAWDRIVQNSSKVKAHDDLFLKQYDINAKFNKDIDDLRDWQIREDGRQAGYKQRMEEENNNNFSQKK